MIRPLLALVLALLLALPAARPAQARDVSVFVFGHSLIHHVSDSETTGVPHWLALMARAGGHGLRLDGAWGFLPDHARNLPPRPQWGFAGVDRAWTNESTAFRMAGFDAVILATPNFIQDWPPTDPVHEAPALDLAHRILDWSANQMDPALAPRLFLYEGWPPLRGHQGLLDRFPPGARGFADWKARTAGPYHDWHEGLLASLRERLPGRDIRLIPTASVLGTLLAEEPLADIPAEALFYDDDPHGTATFYLLAAMVTYAALWGEAPPAIALSPDIHPAVAAHYDALADRVAELAGAAPRRAALPAPDNPALAMGLNGIADWSTQTPFLDRMRSARPWLAHENGVWGAWTFERLREGGYLSPEGWPRALPPGAGALETFVLTDLPPGAASLAGTYILRWQGTARVSVGGRARDVRPLGARALRFAFAPGEGAVSIAVSRLDPADPLRAMTLLREDQEALFAAGEVFDPDFLARVGGFRALRFMDWMATNGSTQARWQDRPQLGDFTWAWRGVPVEVMVDLANRVGADPWFTLPHGADDDYVTRFAQVVHDRLDPRLKVHAEWSNEVWNWIFPQAAWARDRALARWGDDPVGDGWMQYAGLRAAEVADLWAAAFADAPHRLVRVVGVHTGWPGLEDALLDAPRAVAEGRPAPSESFDAYAVTGYFGYAALGPDRAQAAMAEAREGRLAASLVALSRADIADLRDRLWPHHREAAARRGLRLVAYEAGPHIVPEGPAAEDGPTLAALADFAHSPAMGALMAELIDAWAASGGTLLAPFVDTAPPSRWGAWGALRWPGDWNPRWQALLDANARPLWWDEPREAGTFADRPPGKGIVAPEQAG